MVILRYRIFRQTQKTAFLSAEIPGFDMRLDGFSPFFMLKPPIFRLKISPFRYLDAQIFDAKKTAQIFDEEIRFPSGKLT